jgi:uncharacterized membrane protein
MLERLFSFLFKYRPIVFERGELGFASPWPAWVLAAVALALLALAVVPYLRSRRLERRDRVILASLRAAAFAILALCLARPLLVVATVVPQQNFLGILVDDSRSMRIVDHAGSPRSEFASEHFGPDGSPLLSALAERFKLRFFRFSESAQRVSDVSDFGFAGRRTDLGVAIAAAQRELAAVPLAGLVLVSDGAENGESVLTESLLQLQASGVPLHTVGIGQEHFAKDIAIRRANPPRAVLHGSSVAVDLTITHSGFGGKTVQVVVESDGRILSTRDVDLPRSQEATTARTHFTADETGPRLFRFRIAPEAGELVAENNSLETLIDVQDARRKILYFEGEPRWEVKFLRRALAEDENVRVVVLQRTADDKFYRLDVEEPDELAGGFPATREELFRYDGLILGSVEASFFTHDQLNMIADFVGRRGGGLLALGGRRAFAEGGYGGTPVADVLPVVLPAGVRRDTSGFVSEVKVGLTPFGRTHAVTQLATDERASEDRWNDLPPLTTVNRVTELKPGASTLLAGDAEGLSEPAVVLAYQRYGRGRAMALPVQDTWLWQMHADIPVEDQTHETLWRQLLRWLVSGVTNHVSVTTSADRVESGTPVTLTAEVSDSGFLALNGAQVSATVSAPSGAERDIPMEWSVERDGQYRATFVPTEDGLHRMTVRAEQRGSLLGSDVAYVQSGDLNSEFVDAEMNASLLRRIADETGGKFYTPGTVASLPEDVSFTESGTVVHEQRDLWDMPILFIALLGLVGTEWAYRRTRGLP